MNHAISELVNVEVIAQKSPDAVSFGKRLLNESWHGSETAGFQLEHESQKSDCSPKTRLK